jgi:hypothetical protein
MKDNRQSREDKRRRKSKRREERKEPERVAYRKWPRRREKKRRLGWCPSQSRECNPTPDERTEEGREEGGRRQPVRAS